MQKVYPAYPNRSKFNLQFVEFHMTEKEAAWT